MLVTVILFNITKDKPMKNNYTYRSVNCRAKKDARNWRWKFWPFAKELKSSEPKSGQLERASFEEELFHLGESLIAEIVEKWKKLDMKLKPKFCEAKSEDIRADANLEKLTKEKEDSFHEYKAAKEKLNTFKPPPLDKSLEFILLFIIGISEFFINRMIFQQFGESEMATNILAAGIGFLLPILAYWFGYLLKQERRTTIDNIWLIVLPLGALGVLFVISEMRSVFFKATGIMNELHLDEANTNLSVWFYIINIGFFIGASVISFFAAHPEGDIYKQAKKIYKNTLKEFNQDEKEVKMAADEVERTDKDYQNIMHLRAKTHQKLLAEANSIKENTEWLMKSYKATNLAYRSDFPPCFKKELNAPEIPTELIVLDWHCEELDKNNMGTI